jgi:hypothetical protein
VFLADAGGDSDFGKERVKRDRLIGGSVVGAILGMKASVLVDTQLVAINAPKKNGDWQLIPND